jgi:hypothetical protein
MTAFSADWLALRELADARARSPVVTALLADRVRQLPRLRLVDLGTGTGANLRFLAPRLGGVQEWVLTDGDAALLGQVRARTQAWRGAGQLRVLEEDNGIRVQGRDWQCRVETRRIDLATALDDVEFPRDAVVTASALLDLVSGEWLGTLVRRCLAARATALFALSYDGRVHLLPAEPDDDWIRTLVNRHQRGDKGFGPALGPDAAARARERFGEMGYDVRCEPSDWQLGPDDAPLQRELIAGWAHAASGIAPAEAARCASWLRQRLAHVAAGGSRIVVGHTDIIAWLP